MTCLLFFLNLGLSSLIWVVLGENVICDSKNALSDVFRALGVPATDYVMEGKFPVSKLGGLSLPVETESPPRETLSLLYKNG